MELFEAADWYGARSGELSAQFTQTVEGAIAEIQRSPYEFPSVYGRARRAVLPRFPYSIIYTVSDDEIVVVSCFHTRRHPRHWRKRL